VIFFITPWFLEIDPNTFSMTIIPIWACLLNFPLPLWNLLVLEEIGNTLGVFVKIDVERVVAGLCTYARIYVEIDIGKGLLDIMILKHESFIWTQVFGYENATFQCQIFQQIVHL
jgi:hypothetical protein